MGTHLDLGLGRRQVPHVNTIDLGPDRNRAAGLTPEIERTTNDHAGQHEYGECDHERIAATPLLARGALGSEAVLDRVLEAVDPHPLRGSAHRPQSTSRSRSAVALR